MSTVTELVAMIDALYPNMVSTATKVVYMNMAQNGLSNDFGLIATDTSLSTVEDDDEYPFPTGIDDIGQIESVEIETEPADIDYLVASTNMIVGAYTIVAQPLVPSRVSVTSTKVGTADTMGTVVIVGNVDGTYTTETITPVSNKTIYGNKYFDSIVSITGVGWVINNLNDTIQVGISSDRYELQQYRVAYKDEYPRSGYCVFQEYSQAGVKSLVIYPVPDQTGCNIKIRYRKKLTALSASSMSASPDFDSTFHDMLAFYACYMIAKSGSSPDDTVANQYLADYDASLTEMWRMKNVRQINSPNRRKFNDTWNRTR